MKYPSIGMKRAFDKMNEYNLIYTRYNENHTLEHRRSILDGLETWEYRHYGTWVGSVRIDKIRNNKVVVLSNRGWSSTDRDNFNGLLILLGINSVRVVKRDCSLLFKQNGKILDTKVVTIYD